jgi:hypothetical protein
MFMFYEATNENLSNWLGDVAAATRQKIAMHKPTINFINEYKKYLAPKSIFSFILIYDTNICCGGSKPGGTLLFLPFRELHTAGSKYKNRSPPQFQKCFIPADIAQVLYIYGALNSSPSC